MRVAQIDIVDLHYSLRNHVHKGYVSMELQRGDGRPPVQVQFLCHAQQPADCPTTLVTRDLITDALRQAHRMPGFRRGERTIEVEISSAHVTARTTSPR